MKNFIFFAALLLCLAPLGAQQAPAAWRYYQELRAGSPGVYRYKLPLEALDRSLPALEDLRLFDAGDKEVPYMLEAPRPVVISNEALPGFKARLEGNRTILTAQTGPAAFLEAVTLESPSGSFIKPADVFLSMDGTQWKQAAQGSPVFRQYCNSENLRVDIAPSQAKFIKVVIDDSRSAPVPFTGLRAKLLPRVPPALATAETVILSKEDYASSSRVSVRLPARNLFVFAVQLSVSDKLFSRTAAVSSRALVNGRITSRQEASDVIFATDAAGASVARTKIQVNAPFTGTDELVIDVDNGNSPPLAVSSVKVIYAPVYAVFQARTAGVYRLAFGNRQAAARSYDLAGISAYLTGKNFAEPSAGAVATNPGFAAEEALPGLAALGGEIDTARWPYKTAVSTDHRGVQELELNGQVISRAARDLRDLRLVTAGKQVPYILDRDYTQRSVPATAEKKEGAAGLGVWRLKLPYAKFPLTQLTAQATNGVFQRRVTLYETAADMRGTSYRRELGSAVWTNTGQNGATAYSVSAAAPAGDEIELETENGDNKALELSGFKLYYPVSRLIFKWNGEDGLWLYYGNNEAGYPSYDISLVAQELLRGEKQTAHLEGETGENSDWGTFRLSSALAKTAFWAALAAVAGLLIFLIVRLLPPPEK